MAGLDGVRALAVIVVVGYHAGIGWMQGGFVGVDVFFVLSGLLITGLLVERWDRNGHIDLPIFWLRRARRLLPALATMVTVVVATATVADRANASQLRGDVLAAATYTSNWWQIHEHHSYFAQFAPPSLLQHLWSLAVEEQFYLLWPLLLVAGLVLLPRRALRWLMVAGAIGSATAMAIWYQPHGDPSRLYFGTDTHSFGLLLGSALAMTGVRRASTTPYSSVRPVAVELVGVAGLVGIAVTVVGLNELSSVTYRGGLALAVTAAACLVWAAAQPGSWVSRCLGARPLVWIGQRSYGIYLWHWPALLVTWQVFGGAGTHSVVGSGMAVTAAVLAAAASYRFVEMPIRERGFKVAARDAWQRATVAREHGVRGPGWLAPVGVAVICVTATTGMVFPPAQSQGVMAQIAAGEQVIAHQSSQPDSAARPLLTAGRHGGSPELRVHGIPGATWQRLGDAATGGHGPFAQRSRHGRSAQSTHGQGRARVHHVAPSHGRPGHHAAGRQYLGGRRHHSSRPAPVAGKDIPAIGDSVMVAAAPALEQRLQG
ncbi:MAG: acyltransferase family protein, partial [Nocardioidaceae bacterium]